MNVLEKLKAVTTFVFDMDGVLTDGSVIVLNGEQQLRRMHVKDGLGLQMAIQNGYRVMVLSGGSSDAAKERFAKLGIDEVYMSVTDKSEMVSAYLQQHALSWAEILFMGDDLPDVDLLKMVGVSACPADAIAEIREFADYISPYRGGWGCVRDIIEKTLKVNGHWQYKGTIASR